MGRLVRSVLVITFKDSLQRILVDSHIPTADDVHKNESEKFGRTISTQFLLVKRLVQHCSNHHVSHHDYQRLQVLDLRRHVCLGIARFARQLFYFIASDKMVVPRSIYCEHAIIFYAHIDSSKWSKAMLRTSRSRVSQSMVEQMMEREELMQHQQQQDGHPLLTSSSSSDSYWWQQDFVNDWDSLSDSDRYEIMVNLFTTKWQDLVHFFWNHKFVVGIFLCPQDDSLDQVYYS